MNKILDSIMNKIRPAIDLGKEFFAFIRFTNKWWLLPILLLLFILGTLFFVSQSAALAPFIYTLF